MIYKKLWGHASEISHQKLMRIADEQEPPFTSAEKA
jgi:hypothetical protein